MKMVAHIRIDYENIDKLSIGHWNTRKIRTIQLYLMNRNISKRVQTLQVSVRVPKVISYRDNDNIYGGARRPSNLECVIKLANIHICDCWYLSFYDELCIGLF